MRIVLINPPFFDPLVPPASLAALAESLASAADVVAFDLSLEVFNLLFDSAQDACASRPAQTGGLNLAPRQVEDAPTRVRLGKQFRAAFQSGIPAILKMKESERQIQAALNGSAEGRFRIGRGSLEPYSTWPPALLNSTLSQFSSSVFGRAVAAAVTKILPAVAQADCVGISAMFTSQTIPALLIAQLLRREGYAGVIALGGVIPTYTHEYLVTHPLVQELIDLLYVGEFPSRSEEFVNYCAALSRVARNKRTLTVLHRGLVETPNTAGFPPELTSNGSGFTYLPLSEYWGAEPSINLAIEKGCYWGKCAFCDRLPAGSAKDGDYIHNSSEQAVQRMISFQEKLGVSVLSLESEVIDPRTMVEVARGLAQQRTRLTWLGIARFENGLTRRVLEQLFEGGCRHIFFGLESGSPRMLQRMGKGIQLSTVKRILHDCAEVGIGVGIGLFFGFPGEQGEDAALTLDFVAENADLIHRWDTGSFVCVRGSAVGRTPEKYGIEIVEPGPDWDALTWRDLTGATLKDPQRYVARARAIRPERFLLDFTEDQWLVCKYGVRAVDEQLRQNSSPERQ